MAEIEFSALTRDLPERVGDRPALEQHVRAWEQARNEVEITAPWRFTTTDARIKLRKLGEFKWSSQHLGGGVCDGHAETAFGLVGARRVVLARPARGGAA